jgi:prostaglandin-endoperoxide synthase 2
MVIINFQVINDGVWPPLTKDAKVPMTYPKDMKMENQFALGHTKFGFLPGLFMYATIWLREHNRVCDILKAEHPEWNDERLFQTAKLVVLGKVYILELHVSLNHVQK